MMNEGYTEILIKKGKTAKDSVMKALTITVTAVLFAMGIFFFNPLFLLIAVVMAFLAYNLIMPNFDLEYEYLYVNGDIDVDKIMGRSKRKKAASFAIENLEMAAPTGSSQLAVYGNRNLPFQDFTSLDPNKKSWTLVYSTEKGQQVVKLELPDEILQDMRRFAPRKIFFN